MNNHEKNRKQHSISNLSSNSFNVMNTKSDPSQTGSPIPFQNGDFSSVDRNIHSSKTVAEMLCLYLAGSIIAAIGCYLYIKLPLFANLLENTILSFAITFGIIILSFVLSHFITKVLTAHIRNK